jgi:hypothetical protein
VGSGWIIYNNKGLPVRQYEPFFSATHFFEFAHIIGVSSILYYDPLGRIVCILYPNGTYEKVLFDSWKQISYDVNDTVTSDPRTDVDTSHYVISYFTFLSNNWETWFAKRQGITLGPDEQAAANKASMHADTPTTSYFDAMGRTFLTFTNNGFKTDGTAIRFSTRIELDIKDNLCAVIDAKDRIAIRYDHDMLGNQIKQESMDSATRWILRDVLNNPIYKWDSRGNAISTKYDELRRPLEVYLQTGTIDRKLVELFVYGEEGQENNHHGRIFKHFDGAGLITIIMC